MKEDRYCEICSALVGTMSDEAWVAMERKCELCLEADEGLHRPEAEEVEEPWYPDEWEDRSLDSDPYDREYDLP